MSKGDAIYLDGIRERDDHNRALDEWAELTVNERMEIERLVRERLKGALYPKSFVTGVCLKELQRRWRAQE